MATLYVKDGLLYQYASEYGSPDEAKEAMKNILEENAPGEDDG
jgi:hypothetical protein